MSRLLIDQDFETDNAPLTLGGTAMARSTTNAIDGTDLRGGDGTAKTGYFSWAIPAADRPLGGSARGFVLQHFFKFKKVTGPTGGVIDVMGYNNSDGSNCRLRVADGANVLHWLMGADSAVTGTAALGTTAHNIEIEIRAERNKTPWTRVWVDGVLDIEQRLASTAASFNGFNEINACGVAVAKVTWEAIWGQMKLRAAYDPQ